MSQLLEIWALEPQNLEYPELERTRRDHPSPSSISSAGHDAATPPPPSPLEWEQCQAFPGLCYIKSLHRSCSLRASPNLFCSPSQPGLGALVQFLPSSSPGCTRGQDRLRWQRAGNGCQGLRAAQFNPGQSRAGSRCLLGPWQRVEPLRSDVGSRILLPFVLSCPHCSLCSMEISQHSSGGV